MASSLVLTIKSARTSTDVIARLKKATTQPREAAITLAKYFEAMAAGLEPSSFDFQTAAAAPVAASATATLASVAVDDTITIGKTTLTAKASPANENQFSQAGTDTVDAASLVAKINAHSVLSTLVFASSLAGVVTISALQKGEVGNHIALTSSDARITVTGSGYLASGTGGATTPAVNYSRGQ